MHNNVMLRIAFLLLISLCMNSAQAEEKSPQFILEVASSDWRPYVYEENGVIKGSAYKIAKDVLDRAGVQFNYRILPWARVYRNGLDKENYLIGGLGRTPKRENLFHWIGPVTVGTDIFFYKLKSNSVQINHIDDAKDYPIGVERDSYYHDFLLLNEFDENNISPVTNPDQLVRMLASNRVPFILLGERRFLKLAEELGLDPALFDRALFAFNVTDNLAFSKNTSAELVKKLRGAYRELVSEGKIRTVLLSTVGE